MQVSVVAEPGPDERRVALVPDAVGRLTGAGLGVVVQSGAGAGAYFPDDAYAAKGARVVADQQSALTVADVLLAITPPEPRVIDHLRPGSAVLAFTEPTADALAACRARGVSAFSLIRLPRITRAQAMDALSSQATVAGYAAVLLAAQRLPKFLPMFMSAAGTVPPARVLVLGVGVAGLQAIATARRLGAVVEANDVRAAAKEEAESIGARFLDLGLGAQEGAGGYARTQSEDFLRRQQELLAEHVAAADVVITTAAVPGRPAPRLLPESMVRGMRPGSVVVDLGAQAGGNCELSRPGEDVVVDGVTVVGAVNLPATVPNHASALYARNITSLLMLCVRDGNFAPDYADEIVAATCVTGQPADRTAPQPAPEPTAAPSRTGGDG